VLCVGLLSLVEVVCMWPIWTLLVTDMVKAVADVVCGRFRLWPIWSWPIWFVADIVVIPESCGSSSPEVSSGCIVVPAELVKPHFQRAAWTSPPTRSTIGYQLSDQQLGFLLFLRMSGV